MLGKQLKQQLDSLLDGYTQKLPRVFEQIETTWQTYQDIQNIDDLQTLYRELHTLSSNTAPFGFPDISKQARQLELKIEQYLSHAETQGCLTAGMQDDIEQGIQDLYDVAPKTLKRKKVTAKSNKIQVHAFAKNHTITASSEQKMFNQRVVIILPTTATAKPEIQTLEANTAQPQAIKTDDSADNLDEICDENFDFSEYEEDLEKKYR